MQLEFTPSGVLAAYREGIFPMADEAGETLYWLRPDPRAIIPLATFHTSRSLGRVLRSRRFGVSCDRAFGAVIAGCADRPETWISHEFVEAYSQLHAEGYCHSVEVWYDGRLAGGLYGVAIGGAFMAESMFHRETNASKVALAALVERLRSRGYTLLDVQYMTAHLASLGAIAIPHSEYYVKLQVALGMDCRFLGPGERGGGQ